MIKRTYLLAGFLTALSAVVLGGCVHRRFTVKSDPPGALCRLEGNEVGRTPVTVSFDHYGVRIVSLEHDGYVRLVKNVPVRPPWYQIFPIDFFFDVLYPGHIFDDHKVELKLDPRRPYTDADAEKLIQRARQMRTESKEKVESDPAYERAMAAAKARKERDRAERARKAREEAGAAEDKKAAKKAKAPPVDDRKWEMADEWDVE